MPGITGQPSQVQSGLMGLITGLAQGAAQKQSFEREADLRNLLLQQTLAERQYAADQMRGGREYAADQGKEGRLGAADEYGNTRVDVAKIGNEGVHYKADNPPPKGAPKNTYFGGASTPGQAAALLKNVQDQAAKDAFGVDQKGHPNAPTTLTAEQATAYNNALRNRMGLAGVQDTSKIPDYYTQQTAPVTPGAGLMGLITPGEHVLSSGGGQTWAPNNNWSTTVLGQYGQNAVPKTTTSPGANPPPAAPAGGGLKPPPAVSAFDPKAFY